MGKTHTKLTVGLWLTVLTLALVVALSGGTRAEGAGSGAPGRLNPLTTPPPPLPTPRYPPRGDVNNDRTADLVWRNDGTGETVAWLMSGGAIAGYLRLPTISPPSGWSVAGLGDLSGDHMADLIWRNAANQYAVWLIGSGGSVSYALLPALSTDWWLAGVGDLNADGKSDLIWSNSTTGQYAAWLMNGGTVASYAWLPSVGNTWSFVGVGDLNGDGKSDLIWRNTTTGQNVAWLMNGGSVLSYDWLPTVGDAQWYLLDVADFNNDGTADLLWGHYNGQLSVWLMSGGAVSSYTSLPTPASDWYLGAVGDINGNGAADLVYTNLFTGQTVAWLISDGSLAGYAWLPSPGWTLVAPRGPTGALELILYNSAKAPPAADPAAR